MSTTLINSDLDDSVLATRALFLLVCMAMVFLFSSSSAVVSLLRRNTTNTASEGWVDYACCCSETATPMRQRSRAPSLPTIIE